MSTVSVFEGVQPYSNSSKRISVDQLSKHFPQLFLKKDVNRVANFEDTNQFSLEALFDGKMFIPFPLKEYLLNNLKKMDEESILNMAMNLINKIVKGNEKNCEQLLDFTLVFMDCCAELIKTKIPPKIVEALQGLSKELEILLIKIETSKKQFAEEMFRTKITPTVPLTDYYIERIDLKKILMILLFGCTFWSVLFLVNAMDNLLAFDNLHNETCVKDTNCPSEMFCKKDINLCVCNDDFIFSNQLAMCEQSKKFENFSIAGPSIINLNEKEVYFNLLFEDYISRNWTYQWSILNGSENANFTGLNTQMLKMIILKPGFVSLSITIKNLTSRGYKQHNLTIYDQNLFPIIKIENLKFILPLNYVVLNAEKSSNAKYFKWIPDDDLPAKMVVGSPLNESKLFLNNLVPGTFLFNLSVWNDYSPFNDTKIVEINVFKGSSEENLIEIVSSLNNFTFKNSTKLLKEIEKILEFQTENKVLVKFTKMTSKTSFFGNELILFYFYASKLSKNKEILDAEQIVSSLQNNLTFQKSFGIVQIVPYYCKSCSGHGKCDKLAKNCVCDDFWMPNIFVKMTNNGRNLDCSWPSIVVWTSLFFILYLLAKLLVLYWKKDEEERLDKSKLLEDLLCNYKQPSKQIGKFSPVKTVKRRRGKDCLNKFKKRFLEYSGFIFFFNFFPLLPQNGQLDIMVKDTVNIKKLIN